MTAVTERTPPKLSLLQLVGKLGNLSKARKVMGYRRFAGRQQHSVLGAAAQSPAD